MVVVCGLPNRYSGTRSMNVPAVISSRIVTAPRNLPSTTSQGLSGSVMSSSMVRPLYSPAKTAASTPAELTVNSRMPMLRNVSSIEALPVQEHVVGEEIPGAHQEHGQHEIGDRRPEIGQQFLPVDGEHAVHCGASLRSEPGSRSAEKCSPASAAGAPADADPSGRPPLARWRLRRRRVHRSGIRR